MSEHIRCELDGNVLVVRMQRAEKKNALTMAMYEGLIAAYEQLANDAAARVMLLTGDADCFTSGNDIQDFLQNPPTGPDSPVSRFLVAAEAAEQPVVAAVNGVAIGVGTTMLLHCDLVYAARSAMLQMPFINLALVPENASSLLLPKIMGRQLASELLLLGEAFTADRACELGIVNQVFDDTALYDGAMDVARKLAAKPPEAMRLSKRLLKGEGTSVKERIQEEGAIFHERLHSPEAIEALTAFMERRAPDFSKFD